MDEIAKQICYTFDDMYPDAHCELNHRNHFELLVAVMLSAQTTDRSVNKVTKNLFDKYKTPQDFALASLEEIEQQIKQLGLYKNKTKNLKKTSQMLIDDFESQVPDTRADLIKLPGVGRKTANVVLSVAFNQPALAVDTHVERVSKRLNIASDDDSVLTVERKLNAFFPKYMWNKLHHQMIFFGRYHCLSRKPHCRDCQLKEICRYDKKI